MKVVLQTSGEEGLEEAITFSRDHAIIRNDDIRKINALAKRLGFDAELRAIDVKLLKIVVQGRATKRSDRPRAKKHASKKARLH